MEFDREVSKLLVNNTDVDLPCFESRWVTICQDENIFLSLLGEKSSKMPVLSSKKGHHGGIMGLPIGSTYSLKYLADLVSRPISAQNVVALTAWVPVGSIVVVAPATGERASEGELGATEAPIVVWAATSTVV